MSSLNADCACSEDNGYHRIETSDRLPSPATLETWADHEGKDLAYIGSQFDMKEQK